jgi:bifunctional NMN adenylyltransferase/nudix hydrolase
MRDRYDYVVFIARCQPPHTTHHEIIKKALEIATKKVLIVLGSHRAAPDIKNPWSADQRAEMIRSCFPPDQQERLQFLKVADHHYNDNIWIAEVQHKVRRALESPICDSVAYIGHHKDASSYYLDFFPNWQFIESGLFVRNALAATTIRESYFGGTEDWRKLVDKPVEAYLDSYKNTNEYKYLVKEYQHVVDYRESWRNTPYPVTFVTTDAVVTKSGHVLLIRRKMNPGKGLFALPGGFLSQNQTLLDSALRELREETEIKIPTNEMKKYLVDSHPFDYPERSMRGRTVTFAFHFKLPDGGDLPSVDGGDDASEALWMPIGELYYEQEKFFEDHLHIIEFFVNKR